MKANKYRLHTWFNTKTRGNLFSIQIKTSEGWKHLLTAETAKKSIYGTKEEAKAVMNYLKFNDNHPPHQ